MKKIILPLYAFFYSSLLLAQEDGEKMDIEIAVNERYWYASPWIWIIGAALFILLLVALTRGKKE